MKDLLEEMRQMLDKKEEIAKQGFNLLYEASILIKASMKNNSPEHFQRKCWLEEYIEFRNKLGTDTESKA